MARPRATGEDASPAFPRRPAAPRMKFLATSDPAASAPRVAGDGGGFIAEGGTTARDSPPRGELSRATTDLAASSEARAFLADSAAGVDGSSTTTRPSSSSSSALASFSSTVSASGGSTDSVGR